MMSIGVKVAGSGSYDEIFQDVFVDLLLYMNNDTPHIFSQFGS